ncbi:hypothetical protein [Paraburkholderia dilworthii]|uniref:Uncharacterized protein n=1 Tax=Paraburkholderia dilworthii TaxID=948106 RepID=A0ABW9D282_9BURK
MSAENYQDYYRQRGTTLPRAIASDPMNKPYDLGPRVGGTADGSTLNMSREARREFDGRQQSELDARNAADQARRNPELKFNIRPPEMPKPVTAD